MRESPAGMSMYGSYQSCPRSWALKYALGFQRSDSTTVPLVHGSAVHEGKKVFYETWCLENAIERSIEIVRDQSDVFDDLKIEERRLKELFQEWFNVYGETEADNYRVITNETEEIITLPNGAEITLRIDQVLQEIATGHIYIFDTKTTGWSLEGTITDYNFKAQPLLYIASVYQSNPAWLANFRGWITDVMYQRVNYRRGSLSSISTKCQRSPAIMYTEDECLSFLESLTTVTSDVAWAYSCFKDGKPLNGCFPMNRTSCRNFNRTCQFWPICFKSFTMESKTPPPFQTDPWKKKKVIENVIAKIRF